MRILHVNKYLYRRGGAEGYMLDVAALQSAAGHEVAFFGMDHPDNSPSAFAGHFPSHVELEPPPPGIGSRVRAASRMIWSPSSRRGMDEVLAAFEPDVVHLHNIYHQLSPSILRPLAARGVPSVMTLHDYKLACPSYQFLADGKICEACIGGAFQNAVLKRCKDGSLGASTVLALETALHRFSNAYGPVRLFISPSQFLADKMRQAGVFPERMHVLNNFTDAAVTPKSAPGGPVVFAGRLSREKGVDTLIQAVALLPSDVRLEIAGDGPERATLERLAERVAPGHVRFHGRLDKRALLGRVRSACVAAVPSRWYENQPMAVLEAFSCGVPVVTTDLGGLPELVEPGRDGEISPADDPGALGDVLKRVLADPANALEMGRAARRKAEKQFAPALHLSSLGALYEKAMACDAT